MSELPSDTDVEKELNLKYKDGVENKSTDSTLKPKQEAWQDIVKEFNEIPQYVPRSEKRKLCDTLKIKRKKMASKAKKAMMADGGGPSARSEKRMLCDTLKIKRKKMASKAKKAMMIDGGGPAPIPWAIDSDTLVAAESGSGIFKITSDRRLEQTSCLNFVEEVKVSCKDGEATLETPKEGKIRHVLTPRRHIARRGRRGVRRELELRAEKVQRQIKCEGDINACLLTEAKFRALAAEEAYKESVILRKKAELELQLCKEKVALNLK